MTELFTPLHIIFYVFATVAIAAGINVVIARNPIRSVLSLVVAFFAMAGTWMLLRAEFLSIILVVVYVGAVMTLFLFVIMMLNIDREAEKGGFVRYLPFAIIISVMMAVLLMTVVGPAYFGLTQMPLPAAEPADFSNTAQLGLTLFTDYVYPFEIAGVILLAAIIAAITLANRGPLRRKVQRPADQSAVRPQDRLRIVKMKSEPKFGSEPQQGSKE